MNEPSSNEKSLVAIACGGTGGHLFPGLAVGRELLDRGCEVMLVVSQKEIDRRAVKTAAGMEIVHLPAVGLGRNPFRFLAALWKSRSAIKKRFRARRPVAVLGMGGFTSAAPILAGRSVGAKTFLHESNTIPGRANRWLARIVDEAFVWFPETSQRFANPHVTSSGMPVRAEFAPGDAALARERLGLQRDRTTLLVMGGSQGAHAINEAAAAAAEGLFREVKDLQVLHLTGATDLDAVKTAWSRASGQAVCHAFLDEMDLALRAADLVVSRAGASSLAEFAAVGVPAILIPYPHAADNHQFHNAGAMVAAGAARMLEAADATPERLGSLTVELLHDPAELAKMRERISEWRDPHAARRIADCILAASLHGASAGRNPESGKCGDVTGAVTETDASRLSFVEAGPPS